MCKFFVIPGTGAALLGIPDIKLFYILSIMCNTIDRSQRCTDINAQMKEEKCNTKIQALIQWPRIIKLILQLIFPARTKQRSRQRSKH